MQLSDSLQLLDLLYAGTMYPISSHRSSYEIFPTALGRSWSYSHFRDEEMEILQNCSKPKQRMTAELRPKPSSPDSESACSVIASLSLSCLPPSLLSSFLPFSFFPPFLFLSPSLPPSLPPSFLAF